MAPTEVLLSSTAPGYKAKRAVGAAPASRFLGWLLDPPSPNLHTLPLPWADPFNPPRGGHAAMLPHQLLKFPKILSCQLVALGFHLPLLNRYPPCINLPVVPDATDSENFQEPAPAHL
jgi:hypothetical protein